MDPEATLALHLELGADDPSFSAIVRGCFALAALEAHTCVRAALGARSRRPRGAPWSPPKVRVTCEASPGTERGVSVRLAL